MGTCRERINWEITSSITSVADPGEEREYVRFFSICSWHGSDRPDYDLDPLLSGLTASEICELRDKLTKALER